MWYAIHLGLKEESVQTRGVVFLTNHRPCRISHVDNRRWKFVLSSMKEALPIRVRAIHACRPNDLMKETLSRRISMVPQNIRERTVRHESSDAQVLLDELETYGITQENIPPTLGGSFEQEYHKKRITWVEEQFYLELEEEAEEDTTSEEWTDESETGSASEMEELGELVL